MSESFYTRLSTIVRLEQPHCGYTVDDAEDMLKADPRLLGLAMSEFASDVWEELDTRNFVERVGQMYVDATLAFGTPQRVAADQLLTHQIRTLFETIARQRLAKIVAVQLECTLDKVAS